MKYDRNIPFDLLPILPPDDGIFDIDILLQWGYASRALAELNKNILRLPNPDMLVNTIALQEAKSSSAIENIFTTDDELYKAISDSIEEEAANPATKEVLRYREALWAGFKNIKEKEMLNVEAIVSVYQEVKNTTQGIRSPQSQVVIRRGNSEFRGGEVVYTPPRDKKIVQDLMENLIHYLNHHKETDPLIKMAVAHYQLEAIHPFTDGNGRTGRIINLLYLVQEKLLSHPGLYLSKYIIENKEEYYHTLSGVTQRQNWKPWILYMLSAVKATAMHTNQLIDTIINQMNATYEYGKVEIKWYTKELNEILFAQPYIKPVSIGVLLERTSRTTLTKYMKELTDHGILTAKQDGKAVYYLNHDLIRILEE
ncbi:MAG TPA: Fic family protein [Bacteroidetes bacterium]|nr:Fic family protein [Bacteroidota bacterium]